MACASSNGDMQSADSMKSLEESADIMVDQAPQTDKKSKTWKRSQENINKFELFVGDGDKLPLKGSQMTVQVDGFRARVLIDCFFYNDRNYMLEGTFKLRLPNEATPYYFAFGESVYIDKDGTELPVLEYGKDNEIELSIDNINERRGNLWTNPKEARIVPKEKAALAYTQTVNRRVDPALMEWSGAGIFDCNVYPLQAKKLHRIVVGYEVNLTSLKKDKIIEIPLPDNDKPLIVDLDVANVGQSIEITPSENIETIQNRKRLHLENPEIKEISVRYNKLQNCLLTSQGNSTEKYFASIVNIQLGKQQNSNIPENAILMMDVSLSSNPDKFNVWLKMAEALLKNNQDVIKNFSVLFFNIENHWWQKKYVPNTSENRQDLLGYCNQICLIGATDLSSSIKEASNPTWANKKPKNIFLLSDGNITWGEPDVYMILGKMQKQDKLYCFNTGMSGTSLNTLEQLSRETGGAVYSVTSEDEVTSASKAFRFVPWKILDVKLDGCSDLLINGRPKYFYSGQNLLIAGRGNPSKNNSFLFKVEQNGVVKNFRIPFSHKIESDLTKTIYGQVATNQLEEFGYTTEKYSIAYATHYGIPGKTCSFLMLESEQDYAQYNIKPENNLFLINNNPVSDIITKLMDEINKSLGNPKVLFANWLEKLSKTPGMTFEKPITFETLMDKMDLDDFNVESSNLNCNKRFISDYSETLNKQLSKTKLEYKEITKEAGKLKSDNIYDELKVLSSLVEKNQGDGVLLRDIAYSAMGNKVYDQAYFMLKYLLYKRPYEPQTYHAIARSLTKMDKNNLAILYYEIALQTKWDQRFGEFTYIIALDYIRFLKSLNKNKINDVFASYINTRLDELASLYNTEAYELMITIDWNTDFTDIDLHVIEPTREECYYSHPKTKIGGQLTKDVTQGYGPEMYVLKKAKPGKYKIKAKYYSSNINRTSTPTKVYARIYQNWGTQSEKVFTKTVTLKENSQMNDIIEIEIEEDDIHSSK